MNSKVALLLAGILAAAGYTAVVFHFGSNHGAAAVKVKWDAENKKRDIKSAEIVKRNNDLSAENDKLSGQITLNLEKINEKYEQGLAAGRLEYAGRLRESTTRAGIYRKQAEGSASERDHLASHAAELDRALEEGRGLVRELWETVGLRDQQIQQLSKQIQADRALLSEATE